MVIAPFCDCRLCCRDKMEIRKTAHAGRLFFCPSAIGGGAYIFASSESHKNAHRTPPPLRPHHYTTKPTNATQRATESDRANDQSTAAEPPTRDRQHSRRAAEGQRKTATDRAGSGQNLGLCLSKFRPSKFQNLRSKFSRSNSRLRHFRDSVLQAQRSTSAHREDCSE